MRNVFIVFGLVATLGISFSLYTLKQKDGVNYKNSDSTKLSKKQLGESDLKKIQSLIDNKHGPQRLNAIILNLNTPSQEILSSENLREIISLANANLSSLFDCTIRSNCGVNDLISKTIIARHLELVKLILKKDISLSHSVNWIVIRECSGLNNEDIKNLSADLLLNYDFKNNGSQKILEIASTYAGRESCFFC